MTSTGRLRYVKLKGGAISVALMYLLPGTDIINARELYH